MYTYMPRLQGHGITFANDWNKVENLQQITLSGNIKLIYFQSFFFWRKQKTASHI